MRFTYPLSGQLLVWTDIDPAAEDDFNAWYDREHMEERVRIPKMPWARRYRARDDAARRYLSIYRTHALDVFDSQAYRHAFQNQTEWSNRNFARMTNNQRRVAAVAAEAGFGAGAALVLAELAPGCDVRGTAAALAPALEAAGALRAQLLVPDARLSTPLPGEPAEGRVLRPLLLVDLTTAEAADRARAPLRAALAERLDGAMQVFDLLWSLDAGDIAARDADADADGGAAPRPPA